MATILNYAAQLIADLWVWQTGVGFIGGVLGYRLICWNRVRQLDKSDPLPDGRKRHVRGMSTQAIIAAIVILVQLMIVAKTQETADEQKQLSRETAQFAAEVRDCQKQFFEALIARSKLTMENDQLSRQERTAFANWLKELLNPPMARSDPFYEEWGLKVTGYYYAIIDDAENKQIANDELRRQHPLPEPTCGH